MTYGSEHGKLIIDNIECGGLPHTLIFLKPKLNICGSRLLITFQYPN